MKRLAFLLAAVITVMSASLSAHDHISEVGAANATIETVTATGTVKSIAQDYMSLHIFHDPIPALKWPAMNMPFEVRDHELTHPLKTGDRVSFEFIREDGKNIIVKINK